MKTVQEKFMARLNIRTALSDADEQFIKTCRLHRQVLNLLYADDSDLTQLEEIELHLRLVQLRQTLDVIMIEQNLLRAEHEDYT